MKRLFPPTGLFTFLSLTKKHERGYFHATAGYQSKQRENENCLNI